MPPFPDSVYNIYGFLSPAEMELLYRLASEVPKDGTVVEIGSFQGKSTVCLGLGAKESGAWVWSVDPHEDCQVNDSTHYGMENHAALLKNLVDFGVADRVRVVAVRSNVASCFWNRDVHLVFIDGNHDFLYVNDDLCWSMFIKGGRIALHDSSGHYPDVTRAMNEFLERNTGKWVIEQQVDATTVLKQT